MDCLGFLHSQSHYLQRGAVLHLPFQSVKPFILFSCPTTPARTSNKLNGIKVMSASSLSCP
jgi:hypothetical protein